MSAISIFLPSTLPLVWGQMNPFEATREYMNQPVSYQGLGYLLVLIIAAATVWMILYWWEQRNEKLAARSTSLESLFVGLCRRHELTPAHVQHLQTLAEQRKLSDPALVFVDPRYLECQAAVLSPERDQWLELGYRLFGEHFHAVASVVHESPQERPADEN
ncbi:hypothetical protein GC163_04860 [bacterium]|nr:hypothetical protein [bacterium]